MAIASVLVGAIVLGSVSSLMIACMPFFFALFVALAIGFGSAIWHGTGLGETLLIGTILLVVTQLSYGLGLMGQVGLSRVAGWMVGGVGRVRSHAKDRQRRAGNLIGRRRNNVV